MTIIIIITTMIIMIIMIIIINEQRLADQIRGIMKNNWLSVIEREEIERLLTPNEMREDQQKQIDRPRSLDEDSHNNTPPAARSYEAEGNTEYLDKI